ncbi:MAG: flagellar M-ring protein FliF, partial [Chloroflexota bacterium]|nr:flagellar M-ring protein FliF [Chloroflexota bacterium]
MLAQAPPSVPAQMYRFWVGASPTNRMGLVGVALAAIVLTIFVARAAGQPDYAVAFADMKDEDKAAVVATLKQNKIPYELGSNGTISVQAAQVEEARLLVAGSGASAGSTGSGMEFFNQPHFGLTQFAEKVNYQHALESELMKTIGRMDPVASARIHLVIPEPTLFTSKRNDPTGSVVVEMKPGRRLDSTQVAAITDLVSRSVEGMKPENVSVLDTKGNPLTGRAAPGDPAGISDSRAAVQRAVESRVEDDVRSLLTRVLGPDKAIVRAGADLDWDQYEANTQTFSP